MMDKLNDAVSSATYIVGGSLMIGDWLSILDAHAGAYGVLIAGATFVLNFMFQIIRLTRIKADDLDD
ncbi:MAG: hypothetical protein NTY69_02005 [Methylococcales bacterium]|nr:hypothetical protein [Methylococcales bacterium]